MNIPNSFLKNSTLSLQSGRLVTGRGKGVNDLRGVRRLCRRAWIEAAGEAATGEGITK